MVESGPKKNRRAIISFNNSQSSLLRENARKAYEAALRATEEEIDPEKTKTPLVLEYEAFALRFNAHVLKGNVAARKRPPWGEDSAIAEWLIKNFPLGLPTSKVLKNGTSDERALYGAIHRRKMHRYIPRFRPYGDPKEYYKKNHPGKTIGQVDAVDPNFVLYCRYHQITRIMPKVVRNPWEGREEEEFKKKYGDMTPGQVSELGPEGHRDYMRLRRARLKKNGKKKQPES